jgi:hypothetical protein
MGLGGRSGEGKATNGGVGASDLWGREGDETVGQIGSSGGPDGRTRILKHCLSLLWAGAGLAMGTVLDCHISLQREVIQVTRIFILIACLLSPLLTCDTLKSAIVRWHFTTC